MASSMNIRLIRPFSRLGLMAVALLVLEGQVLAQLPPGGPPGSPAAAHRHAVEMQQKQENATLGSPTAPPAPVVDPQVVATTPPPPEQLPPTALPGVIQPDMNPPGSPPSRPPLPGTAGVQAQTPPTNPAPVVAVDTKPAAPSADQKSEVGRMVLGEKIDVLTLEDLQDKLQATPDMILTLSGHTYRMSLLGDFTKSLATLSALAPQSPVAQSSKQQ